MKWYLAKINYQIICGDGNHASQFDEQLRLIHAEDDMHAFQKARMIGDSEEDIFLNDYKKPVTWKFIDVSDLRLLEELTDGAELYSKICEENDGDNYIRQINNRANDLHEACFQKTFQMN